MHRQIEEYRGKRQNIIYLKTNALVRKLMVHNSLVNLPLFIVTEHPKSGGTWVSQMIADYLGIPFPRNRMPVIGPQVMHCHEINLPATKNTFVVFRDGRDVVVSYYYHSLFYNDLYNARHVDRVTQNLSFKDPNDIRNNLARFIEFLYDSRYYHHLTWCDFVDFWLSQKAPIVRYENLLTDAPKELGKAVESITGKTVDYKRLTAVVDKYTFKKQAVRQDCQKAQTKWLRKGIAGDWKNNFTREACEVFQHFAGEALIRAGYEQDSLWVEQMTEFRNGSETSACED